MIVVKVVGWLKRSGAAETVVIVEEAWQHNKIEPVGKSHSPLVVDILSSASCLAEVLQMVNLLCIRSHQTQVNKAKAVVSPRTRASTPIQRVHRNPIKQAYPATAKMYPPGCQLPATTASCKATSLPRSAYRASAGRTPTHRA